MHAFPTRHRLAVLTKTADLRRVLVKVDGQASGEVGGRPLSDLWGRMPAGTG
jgi:hypothetical protein